MHNLGVLYQVDTRVAIDFKGYRRLADANGYFALSNRFNAGIGIAADKVEAAKYYKTCDRKGERPSTCQPRKRTFS